jgi:hypothetical protein
MKTKTITPTEPHLGTDAQAQKLLVVDKDTTTIVLDLRNVITMGWFFANYTFQTFNQYYPNVTIVPINYNKDVGKTITLANIDQHWANVEAMDTSLAICLVDLRRRIEELSNG